VEFPEFIFIPLPFHKVLSIFIPFLFRQFFLIPHSIPFHGIIFWTTRRDPCSADTTQVIVPAFLQGLVQLLLVAVLVQSFFLVLKICF
jgi:hypothetical protein